VGRKAGDRERPTFGELLRQYRGRRGLTQQELAERADLNVQAISMLERGIRRSPRSMTVESLARALKLDAPERHLFVAVSQGGNAESAPAELLAGSPPEPSLHFVGRGAELFDMHRHLERSRRLAINGLGGVGKTQLATHSPSLSMSVLCPHRSMCSAPIILTPPPH
jgi:transcriptional regulator with XRE-family HTH domain